MQAFATRLLFGLGLALLVGAFAAAVGEMIARTIPGVSRFYVPADELWAALGPRSYRDAQRWITDALHPALWDPVLVTLMRLPGWALFGVPGGLLAWFFRPQREPPEDFDPDAPFLYDELAKRAQEEGYGEGDDRLPEDLAPRIVDSAREAGADATDAETLHQAMSRPARDDERSARKDLPPPPPEKP